ncbi:MAG: phosphomannomutase [Nocardioidaceae bacterium]|jgi:phosphomannomutase|nr:phosphomannomutase [Nocardioidaceae bacterium]
MTVAAPLRAAVGQWVAADPDPQTRAELTDLLAAAETDEAALAELRDRFAGRLEFGTAGLRGELAAGPNRMNRALVTRAAAGLAAYLRSGGASGPVVIGYDARHRSREFARDTAEVMAGAGIRALELPHPLPTPVLAFAIRHLGAAAGVMVTASHNPPRDNGYKVYLGDGTQIVPPADRDISRSIDAVAPAADVPRGDDWELLGDEVTNAYVEAVAALPAEGTARELTVAYTPLHGVGFRTVERVLRQSGFAPPVVVRQQQEPDPEFPTVAFPNPEEPGAMDLVMDLAARSGADIAVANDPDADRCAVAVATMHGWRMLRGDEVGVLLGDHLLRRGLRGVFATTIVSSSLLEAMAERNGVPYAETLTGFKWIGRVPGLAYGYEEALGYCASPGLVTDKDGISALLLVCELAAGLRAQGLTLLDRLDDIAREYGVYATDQVSVRVDDVQETSRVMERLRASPPEVLGGFAVESIDDLAQGGETLAPTEALRYRLASGGRVVVRPSGTEPKLKCYLEVVVPVDGSDRTVEAARIAAAGRLDAIRSDLVATAGI